MKLGGYFTLEQVRDTLMANKDDPDCKKKSVRDLRFKQCLIKKQIAIVQIILDEK